MIKDNFNGDHCPYCKRHCSLNNPHCNKGKTLAKKKMEEKKNEGKKRDKKIENSKKISNDKIEERLLLLFQQCYNFMQTKEDIKINKKKYQILSLLMKKGNMTKCELKEETKYEEKVLDKTLRKMRKTGYIEWKQEEIEDKISITDSALLLWRTKQRKNDTISFSALEQSEKEYLEKILSKLNKSWKQD